jgi:hypothetical protein
VRAIFLSVALVAASAALADYTGADPTTAEIADAPTEIQIGGLTLTAVAHVWIDRMPLVTRRDAPPRKCPEEGRFFVKLEVRINAAHSYVRGELEPDRLWVLQDARVWNGRARSLNDPGALQGSVTFLGRDCGMPIWPEPPRYIRSDGSEIPSQLPNSEFPHFSRLPAKTVIRFVLRGKSYLLRAPDTPVFVAL